jgi:hypothetical protein
VERAKFIKNTGDYVANQFIDPNFESKWDVYFSAHHKTCSKLTTYFIGDALS